MQVPSGHWLHENATWTGLKARSSEPTSPLLGHLIERLWPLLFRCGEASHALTCCDQNEWKDGIPACSKQRVDMRPGDCGCMDPA